MAVYQEGQSYSGKIIGESNNRYRNVGFIVDEFGNFHQFDKTDLSYYLCPGTPVEFKYNEVGTDNCFSANNVKARVNNGKGGILWDGSDTHPLISIYNDIGKILLEYVYETSEEVDPGHKPCEHISYDLVGEDNKARLNGKVHHKTLEGVWSALKDSKLDDLILKHLYDSIRENS